MDIQPGQVYEHFKGNRYRVLTVGIYEPTEEVVVVHEALYDNPVSKIWVRPLEIFKETVVADREEVPRFSLVE